MIISTWTTSINEHTVKILQEGIVFTEVLIVKSKKPSPLTYSKQIIKNEFLKDKRTIDTSYL